MRVDSPIADSLKLCLENLIFTLQKKTFLTDAYFEFKAKAEDETDHDSFFSFSISDVTIEEDIGLSKSLFEPDMAELEFGVVG